MDVEPSDGAFASARECLGKSSLETSRTDRQALRANANPLRILRAAPDSQEYVQGGDAQTTDCVALDFSDAPSVRSVV